jgi:hypothetical protein
VPPHGVFVTPVPASGSVAVRFPRRARYALWLGGSVPGRVEAFVDGRRVGGARTHLNNDDQWIELGRELLGPGTYHVRLRFDRAGLRPSSGGEGLARGSLVVAAANPSMRVGFGPECGRTFDWLEGFAR